MYTQFLISMMIFFSTPDGGGVRGKAVGTAHGTTTGDGLFIPILPIFIRIFRLDGDRITEIVIGKDTGGIINPFLIINFSATGINGNKTGIGKTGDGVSADIISARHKNIMTLEHHSLNPNRNRNIGMVTRDNHST